ncbi:MAG: hypothetical protein WD278_01045 [Pirellulales bacterium]
MDDTKLFVEVLRAGNEEAARKVVRDYEPWLRKIVRSVLRTTPLQRTFGSADITQSVFRRVFSRRTVEELDAMTPEELARILIRMVRRKLAQILKKEHAEKRDVRRVVSVRVDDLALAAPGLPADEEASNRETVAIAHAKLSDQLRYVFEQRCADQSWPDLGAELKVNHNTLRLRLSRALKRIRKELE